MTDCRVDHIWHLKMPTEYAGHDMQGTISSTEDIVISWIIYI